MAAIHKNNFQILHTDTDYEIYLDISTSLLMLMTDVSDSDFYGPSDDGFGRSLRLIMLQDSGSSTNVAAEEMMKGRALPSLMVNFAAS